MKWCQNHGLYFTTERCPADGLQHTLFDCAQRIRDAGGVVWSPEKETGSPLPQGKIESDDPSGYESHPLDGARCIHVLPSDVLIMHGLEDVPSMEQETIDSLREDLGVKAVLLIQGAVDFTILREQKE